MATESTEAQSTVVLATAKAVATISDNAVSQIRMTNGGFGYETAPNVVLSGGGGYGAVLQANVSAGTVASVTVVLGGSDFTSVPEVTLLLDGGSPLLGYSIQTAPSPLLIPEHGETSLLNLSIFNPGNDEVVCESILIELPGPGDTSTDLTTSFEGIAVQVPSDGNKNPLWTSARNGGSFLLMPVNQEAGTITTGGSVFTFSNIVVNQAVGACLVKITERAASTSKPLGRRSPPPIELQKWPAGFSMSELTATPTAVPYDGSTVLNWLVRGSQVGCQLLYDPDGSGTQKTVNVGTVGPYTAEHLTSALVVFTLEAIVSDPGKSRPMTHQVQHTVTVGPPTPTIEFSIEPNPVVPNQQLSFTISWKLKHISSFQIVARDRSTQKAKTLPVPYSQEGTYVDQPFSLDMEYILQALTTAEEEDDSPR